MLMQWGHFWRWVRAGAVIGIVWMLYLAMRSSRAPFDPLSPTKNWNSGQTSRHDSCRRHGWKSFKPVSEDAPRKVYDLIMVNTELDWLEIRLNSTWHAVDYYVLVEAARTFTNLQKPLVLRDNMARFEPYRSKIIYHEVAFPPGFVAHRTWDIEDLQRNAMFAQVFPKLAGAQAPTYGDVIVVSDVDEVPRPVTYAVLRDCWFPRRLTLRSSFYYYSFQYLHRGEEWGHPQATYYQGSRTVLPNDLRVGDGPWPFKWLDQGSLANAAWHCSSCFATVDELLTKLSSFAHVSMNADEFRDRRRIADRVRNGRDLWDRPGELYDRIDDNKDVPSFLLDNRERFRYLLDRDGPTAGFSDYEG
ncbi:glycosyltransferase family 17 protein [Lasiosphaeria ovina]|uniref:Glycosyltransferase family 17 protein n=1 Tax=Lasiosphaeria ovina TaxID=92902 RepID=A0AAE0NJS8_9PEZI|nr:glycosyltransferase family 17 protein [Lasiosphaeria ovina]